MSREVTFISLHDQSYCVLVDPSDSSMCGYKNGYKGDVTPINSTNHLTSNRYTLYPSQWSNIDVFTPNPI